MLGTILFWFVMLMTMASTAMVITARNILHAAFALAVTLLGVSALYVFLHADFVAAVQLIVYVGGIIVLVMFAIMFSSHTQEDREEASRDKVALGAGALVAGVVFISVLMIMARLEAPLLAVNDHTTEAFQRTVELTPAELAQGRQSLGHLLLGKYLIPFELASVLIIAALLGAVVIVRKETR